MRKIIGLDIHGTIDHDPEFFRILSIIAKCMRVETHVLTGEKISDKLRNELDAFGIIHTRLFSISTHHQDIGTDIIWEDSNNPVINSTLWNRTKGDYCALYNVDLMIDDSGDYGEFFTTPYLKYDKDKDMVRAILLEFEKILSHDIIDDHQEV
ncbi:MAG: hypothetical protein KAS32_05330 [Candidatus Peribacteraceae bacterium]|nr:hypothetical protein [Candidatus Peribacteraceae bacterium]